MRDKNEHHHNVEIHRRDNAPGPRGHFHQPPPPDRNVHHHPSQRGRDSWRDDFFPPPHRPGPRVEVLRRHPTPPPRRGWVSSAPHYVDIFEPSPPRRWGPPPPVDHAFQLDLLLGLAIAGVALLLIAALAQSIVFLTVGALAVGVGFFGRNQEGEGPNQHGHNSTNVSIFSK